RRRHRGCARTPPPSGCGSSSPRRRTARVSLRLRPSAAARLRRATGPALVGFRGDAGDVLAAGGAVGRAGGVAGVVGGGFAEGVEGFPARALRILGPKLVRLRVAADRRLLRDHGAAGSVEAAAERGQRLAAVRLDAEM